MQIHIARNGQATGPFSLDEVKRQLAAGTLSLSDQAWYEGAPNWMPLSAVPGVGAESAKSVLPSQPAVPASVPAGSTEPMAIWSLVLSLVGLFCCGFFAAIPGIICGHLALSKIDKTPGSQGRGLALAGVIIGYVAALWWLLYLIFFGGLGVLQSIMHNR